MELSSEKEFKVNEFITLKLEDEKTNIYVKGQLFNQCKFLLLNIPVDKISTFDEIESIDEAAEKLGSSLEGPGIDKFGIPPEVEFWGHCSNLQFWAEMNYNTRLLHRNLAFPLLRKLTEAGDPVALKIFKEEIARRIESGYKPVILYLYNEGYLEYLDIESQIYEPLREVFFRILKDNEEIPAEFLKIFFKILLENMTKKELEEVIINSNIIETILEPDFYIYDLIDKDPLELIIKINCFILKDKFFNFFLSPNVEVINGILKHYSFTYLLEKKILDIEDWKLIIENPKNNFFEILKNVTEYYSSELNTSISYFLRDSLKSLATPIKDKILESFHQNNIDAIIAIERLDLYFYFSKEELNSLIKKFFKVFLIIENNSRSYTTREQMKEIFKRNIDKYERVIYQILEEEHDMHSMLNIIDFLQNQAYFRYLNISRLNEISKSNPHLRLLLHQLSNKRTDLDPNLATLLNEIEKILNTKFRKCEPTEINRSILYDSKLRFSMRNDKITTLYFAHCKIEDDQFTEIMKFLKQIPTIEILNLGNNHLTVLPESIGELSNLKKLILGSNNLVSLVNSIGKLSSLEELVLVHNQLTFLPESIGDLKSLKKLMLIDNKISILPETIGNLSSLEVLYLNNNHLTEIPKSIGNLRFLKTLSLERNPIYHLPESLSNLASLETLNISNTKISQFPLFMNELDSLETIWVSPHYKNDFYGLRNLIYPFKNKKIDIYFGLDHDSNVVISGSSNITIEDLYYGKYAKKVNFNDDIFTLERQRAKIAEKEQEEKEKVEFKKEMEEKKGIQNEIELKKEKELTNQLEDVEKLIEKKEFQEVEDRLVAIIHESKRYHLNILENKAKEKYKKYKKLWQR